MKDRLFTLQAQLLQEVESIKTLQDLENFKIKALGKKSDLYSFSRHIGELPAEERKAFGELINTVKSKVQAIVDEYELKLKCAEMESSIKKDRIDVTLPGSYKKAGSLHPVTQVLREITAIFEPLGYDIVTGPEIEHEFYNFEALNMPSYHPARDMQDTFYITEDSVILRTQTSPLQIRTMMEKKPPIRILAPGRVYRSDYDVSHSPMFHQIEGLVVDKDITFPNLKGTLLYFAKKMFGQDANIRLRPSFFPFTEPSAEVDVCCVMCKGKGCRVCKDTGWLEILGCGMVHPKVFKNVGYSPDVTGFAFGMGIERIAMLKYGIGDLRLLFENDARFLQQFLI